MNGQDAKGGVGELSALGTTRRKWWVFAAGLLIFFQAQTVRAEVFYGVTANGIFSVDSLAGGPATQIVTFAAPLSFAATLATRLSDGMLFYLDSGAANPNLWRWDPRTPNVAPMIIGTPGATTTGVIRLGFDAAGTLYAMNPGPGATLWTIDSNTGAILTATPASGAAVPAGGDICVQPSTGILYMVAQSQLFTITPAAVVTLLGTVGGVSANMPGCAFDNIGRLVVTIATAGAPMRVVDIGTLTSTPLPNAALPISPAGATWGDLGTAPGRTADIRLTKTASNLTPGNTVFFTMTITNDGPADATDLRILDLLPAGLNFVSATMSQGTYTSGTGIWLIGTMNNGANATLTMNASVTGTTPMTNTAQVSYVDQPDPDSIPNNNAAGEDDQASVTITPSPDLRISKAATATFVVGVNGTYTLTVNNSLGSFTTGTNTYTVTDTLPAGLTLVGTPTGTEWNCSTSTATQVTCTSATAIAAGATNANPITVTVLPSSAASPSVTNTAIVAGGGEPSSNNGNNSSTITTTVCATNCPDLQVAKTGPASFTVGTNGAYTLKANNTLGGFATSGNYTITDTLPTGLTLVGTPVGTGWNCAASTTTTANCKSSTVMLAGASNPNAITVTVSVANTAVPSVTNTATIGGGGEPSNATGNDSVSITTPVIDFDLTVTKSAPANFTLGVNGTYTLTMNNSGGRATTGTYTITDTLPTGLTFISATGTGWGCSVAGQTVTCTGTTSIAANVAAPAITLTVGVGAAAAPSVTNTATVADPNEAAALTGNNGSTVTTPVFAPDIFVTKTHNGNFTVGTNGIYTITVSNIGRQATTAATVTVADNLPVGMTFVSASGTGWTCAANTPATGDNVVGGTRMVCTSTTSISANSSGHPIALTVLPGTAGNVTNTVSVSGGGEPANNSGNNTDNDATSVFVSPQIAKSFSPASIVAGNISTLTLTITNPLGNTVAVTGVAVVDPFPSGMSVASTPAFTNSCGGTVSPGQNQGDTVISLTGGGPIAIGATCTISVNVTSTVVGQNVNTTGQVSSQNSGIGNTASATLTVTSPGVPVLTKLSAPNPVGVNQNALLTFTIVNKATITNDMGFTDTLPSGVVVANPATFGGSCVSNAGAALVRTATAGSQTITVSGVDLAANASCTITINIMSATPGAYLNNNARISGLAGGLTADVNDTLNVVGTTLTQSFNPASILINAASTLTFTITNGAGNPQQNGLAFTETLPVNVVVATAPLATQCNGVVTAAVGGTTLTLTGGNIALGQTTCTVAVNVTSSTTGNYLNDAARVSGLSVGMTNNVNATLVVTSNGGGRVVGRVFKDTGGGAGGVANDGVQNGTEPGIANVAVRLTDCDSVTHATSVTNGTGDYTLFIPDTQKNETRLCVIETNLGGFISTGATPSAGGNYTRSTDTTQFLYSAGVGFSGVNFGDVPENQFLSDGAQTIVSGAVAYYAHIFIAGTGGSVAFSTANLSTPTFSGWSEVIYQDVNCNRNIDSEELIITSALPVVANQQICIIVKEFAPANAPAGAQNRVTVTAQLTYTNAAPALASSYLRTDLTTIGATTASGLTVMKAVNKATALPGETLTYTMTYTNKSSDMISAITINDATPSYTTFNGATCGLPLPANLTSCTVTAQPSVGGVGAITWTFAGQLASSGSGQVTYTVTINP